MTYLRTLDAAGAIPVVLPPTGTDHLGAAARPPRRHLPVRRPGPRPGGLRRARAPRRARADRAEPRRLRARPRRARRSSAACRSSPSAAAPRRSTSPAAGRCTSTSPATARRSRDARPTHEVEIAARSRLHRIVRTRTLAVNSFHHQAVDRVGDGLRSSPAPTDGTIEAIEGAGFVRRRPVARRDAHGAPAAVRGARYGGFPYRTARRRLTSWAGCPPSACAASSSASAR